MADYQCMWFKSIGTSRVVEERLDKALANKGWHAVFPNAQLEILVALTSYHYLILLNLEPGSRVGARRKSRYENAWSIEPGFRDVVQESWQNKVHHLVVPKVDVCTNVLLSWTKNNCNKLKVYIEECHKTLNLYCNQGNSCDS